MMLCKSELEASFESTYFIFKFISRCLKIKSVNGIELINKKINIGNYTIILNVYTLKMVVQSRWL